MGRFLGMTVLAGIVWLLLPMPVDGQQPDAVRTQPVVRHQTRHRPLFKRFQNGGFRAHYYSAARYNPARARQVYGPNGTFPKFYGGCHASHYNNLGIPNGSIGFRGNGIYWAPWN